MLPHRPAILILVAVLAGAAGSATSSTASTGTGDVAILRDGERREGPVLACVGERCRVGNQDLERSVIGWLGLGVERDAIPPPLAGSGAALVLADGTAVSVTVVGISLGIVVTSASEYERSAVRWVRFGRVDADDEPAGGALRPRRDDPLPTPADDDDDGEDDDTDDDSDDTDDSDDDSDDRDDDRDDDDHRQTDPPIPSDPEPDDEDPPGDRDLDDPRPPNDVPVEPCPADAPLGGHIVEEVRSRTWSEDCSGTAELWFDLVAPPSIGWPQSLYVTNEAQEITYSARIHGCNPISSDACSAPARSASGTMRRAGLPLGLHFNALEPGLRFYFSEIEDLRTPLTCTNGSGSWGPGFGNLIGPQRVNVVAVPPVRPTLCFLTEDKEQQRDCVLHPDRYAVVPFRGEQRLRTTHESGEESTLRWEVCCGCGRPPSGPPPDFDPRGDPCAGAAALQDQLVRRMRTARELQEFAERDKVCAENRRDAAAAHRFGRGGEYAVFFAALGSFASEGQPGASGDLAGLLFALAAVVNEPGRQSIDELALEGATTDVFRNLVRDGQVRTAVREMVAEFNRTGNAPRAVAGFRRRFAELSSGFDSAGKIIKGLTVGMSLKSLYDATAGVCRNWTLEQAWQWELWDAENEMSAGNQRLNDAEVELQVLRRRCPDLEPAQVPPMTQPPPAACPTTPRGQSVSNCNVLFRADAPPRDQDPAGESSTGALGVVPPLASSPGDPSTPSASAEASAAFAELEAALTRVEQGLSKLVPLVILFSPDLEVAVPPTLLAIAATEAVTEGEALKADAASAVELARALEASFAAPVAPPGAGAPTR